MTYLYQQKISEHLTHFINEVYPHYASQINIVVNYSDYEDYQYQTPIAFILKKLDKSFDSSTLITFLEQHYPEYYQKLSITGNGFLSIKMTLEPQSQLDSALLSSAKPSKIIVDYCGVNVAKQMHIGHIRSMFIGDYVVRLHQYLGDDVHIFNHIGDWGNQFGFLLAYIQDNALEDKLDNKKLTQYYKEAYQLYNENGEFAQKANHTAIQLQNYDGKTIALWEKLVAISMTEAGKTFEELGLKITLNDTQGESFYAPYCGALLESLIEKNIATKNEDGSVAVFFSDKSPLVLQKSNGNYLYALYDLAAIQWRYDNLQPEKMIYVVDKRQTLHFEQVFEVAKKAHLIGETTQLVHLGFGTILGQDKKPLKTKSGESLYLDDLIAQGKSILLQSEHFKNMAEDYKQEILEKTIIGGMKYYDLKFSKQQDYIFDWTHVLNFTGGSAPYIQNAIVRIDSILFKKFGMNTPVVIGVLPDDYFKSAGESEQNLLFLGQKTQELLYTDKNYSSQLLTAHAIKLCQSFHQYYEHNKILGSEKEHDKLNLMVFVLNQLQTMCDILGIQTYACAQKLTHQWQSVKKESPKL
jgi:arginyl-tRNA synthetase